MRFLKFCTRDNIVLFGIALFANLFYVIPGWLQISVNLCLIAFKLIRGYRFRVNKSILWFFLFLLTYFCVNLFRIGNAGYITTAANCLITLFVLSLYLETKEAVAKFIKYFAITGIVFCCLLLPYINDLVLRGERLQDTESNIGYFANSVSIGYSLMFIALMQLWAISESNTRLEKIWLLGCFAVSIIMIMLTGTRKAFLAVVIFFITHSLLKTSGIRRMWTIIIGALIVCGLFYLVMNNELLYLILGQRLEGALGLVDSNYSQDASTVERVLLIEKAQNLISSHLIFGAGYEEMMMQLGKHPHNNYLSILCLAGFIPLIVYYYMPIKLLIYYVSHNRIEIPIRIFCIPILLVLLIVDFTATTFNILYFPMVVVLSYLFYSIKQ